MQFWSEAHTGEDFVMMMKMMKEGYKVVYATYMDGWEEGVDESVHVNWTNYCKYVNSTMEMVFNTPDEWLTKGFFTELITEYIYDTPAVPLHAKVATLAYLGTHFAIAFSIPLGWLAILYL